MGFRIFAPGADELIVVPNTPLPEGIGHLTGAATLSASGYFGKMFFQHHAGDGFDIWLSDYRFSHGATIDGSDDMAVLELHIQLLNSFQIEWSGAGTHTLGACQFNLTYTPYLESKTIFTGGAAYQTFDVHYSRAYLDKFASAFPLLGKFLEKVDRDEACHLTERNYALDPRMVLVIEEMKSCPYRPEVARLFYTSKAMELLLLALERVSETRHEATFILSPADEAKMIEARELLVADFEDIPTIMQLARKVGTNDFKLKKGFKQLFGMSVFAYAQAIRLEYARKKILDTTESITHIAYETGYEHVRNFSAAFKKHFGYEPSYLRQHKRKAE